MGKWKRFCSAFLAVVMIICCLPVSGLAVGLEASNSNTTVNESLYNAIQPLALSGNKATPLSKGSETGYTLTTGIYYLTDDLTFTNSAVGGNGITIANGATVVIDLNGHTLTATGKEGGYIDSTSSVQVGGGAGIYLPSTSYLIFIGSGSVNATGGDASGGGGVRQGSNATLTVNSGDQGNGTISNGNTGGAGGSGGGGGGAGIGTKGGDGGAGGASLVKTENSGFWNASNAADAYTGNPGGNGKDGAEAGMMYILGTVNVAATGGAYNTYAGYISSHGQYCCVVARRNDGTTSYSDWALTTAGSGAGGGSGGSGKAGAAYGNGGGGAGGGGSGTPGTLYSIQVNNVSPGDMDEDWYYFSFYCGTPGQGGEGYVNGRSSQTVSESAKDLITVKYHRSTGSDNKTDWSAYADPAYSTEANRFRFYQSGTGGAGGKAGADAMDHAPVVYSSAKHNLSSWQDYSKAAYLSGNAYLLNLSLVDNVSGTTNTAVATVGNSAAISGTPHTRTGYTLKGYYTAASGGSKVLNADLSIASGTVNGYTINGLWNTAANTTLYAQWEPNTYTVTLDNYDGNGNSKQLTATYDAPFPSFDQPEKYGYKLNGYSCISMGVPEYGYVLDSTGKPTSDYVDMQEFGGVFIQDGVWKRTDNVTLYAFWKAKTASVTLNSNGKIDSAPAGLISTYPQPYGSPITASIDRFSRVGYTLNGFFTASSGGTKVINADRTFANDNLEGFTENGVWIRLEDVTLWAQWTKNQYGVTLEANGGSGGTISINAEYDSAFPSFTKHTKTGYSLVGYFTSASGGTKVLNADGTIVSNVSGYTGNGVWLRMESATLYAQWTKNQYNVVLEANGGSGSTINVNAEFDTTFPSFTPHTRVEYRLKGYYTSATGGTKVLNADGTIVSNVSGYTGDGVWQRAEATTLYAQWEQIVAYIAHTTQNQPTVEQGVTAGWQKIYSDYANLTELYMNGYVPDGVTTRHEIGDHTRGNTNVYLYVDGTKGYIVAEGLKPTTAIYVADCKHLFGGMTNLTKLDLTNLDTSKATRFYGMFLDCASLTTEGLVLPGRFDMSSATGIGSYGGFASVFRGCSSLTTLDLSGITGFDKTENGSGINISETFEGCISLTYVKMMPGTPGNLRELFRDCKALEVVDFSLTDLTYCRETEYQTYPPLKDCANLKKIILPDKVPTSNNIPLPTGVTMYAPSDLSQGYNTLPAADGTKTYIAVRYTVTYIANYDGAKDITDNFIYGDVYSVDYSKLSRKYYTLKNMTAAENGTGTIYNNGRTLVDSDFKDGVLKLYAQWQQNTGNAILYGVSLTSSDGWRRKWLLSQYNYTSTTMQEGDATAYSYLKNISAVYVGKLPDGYKIDDDNGFYLVSETDPTQKYAPLDVSSSESSVPCYAYTVGTTVFFVNGFNPDAEVYHKVGDAWMFRGLAGAKVIDVLRLNTSLTTSLAGMFYDCSALESVDLSNFDKSVKYTNVWAMFSGCTSLTEVDLSGFDFSNIKTTDASRLMFYNATYSTLKVIILPDKVPTSGNMNDNGAFALYGDDANMTGYTYLPAKNEETGLTSIRVRYKITYHEGENQSEGFYLYNKNATLKTLTDEKYYAETWNTQADGLGTSYNPGSTVDFNNNHVELYALSTRKDAGASNITIGAERNDVDGETVDVISLNISWGEILFVFAPEHQEWNAEKVTYEAVPAKWTAKGNSITVTNHSNVDVFADFKFTATDGLGIDASYSYVNDGTMVSTESVEILSAVGTTTENAPKVVVYLNIVSGTISKDQIIGQTTVTIRKSD